MNFFTFFFLGFTKALLGLPLAAVVRYNWLPSLTFVLLLFAFWFAGVDY